jgi:protein TonB
VNTRGTVDHAEVTESSGTAALDAAARAAVLHWTFEPGHRGDTPVACRVTVPIHFRLD